MAKEFKIEPLKVWNDFKKYREKYYRDYLEAKDNEGIR